MSLNRTLDRFFDEIRREARRNPAFADRLDAVLRGHDSRRDIVEDSLIGAEPVAPPAAVPVAAPAPASTPITAKAPKAVKPPPKLKLAVVPTPRDALNPVAFFLREGEEALRAELEEPLYERELLIALVQEHNLDPGGEAGALDRADLAELIVARAKRRAERDRKLFDY